MAEQQATVCKITIITPRQKPPPGVVVINTTSNSREEWSRGLSPFYLGPVQLWGNWTAWNVENAWQFSKVYADQATPEGPSRAWLQWAVAGWCKKEASRYPRGRGAKPAYSYWNGYALDYINARKMIYCPLYAQAVFHTEAYARLKQLFDSNKEICLVDYDGYDYVGKGMTLTQVLNNPTRKMGHAFVLAMLLRGEYCWMQ